MSPARLKEAASTSTLQRAPLGDFTLISSRYHPFWASSPIALTPWRTTAATQWQSWAEGKG